MPIQPLAACGSRASLSRAAQGRASLRPRPTQPRSARLRRCRRRHVAAFARRRRRRGRAQGGRQGRNGGSWSPHAREGRWRGLRHAYQDAWRAWRAFGSSSGVRDAGRAASPTLSAPPRGARAAGGPHARDWSRSEPRAAPQRLRLPGPGQRWSPATLGPAGALGTHLRSCCCRSRAHARYEKSWRYSRDCISDVLQPCGAQDLTFYTYSVHKRP